MPSWKSASLSGISASALQDTTNFGKPLLAQRVFFQQIVKLQQRGGICHRFASKVDIDKTT